MIKNIKQYFIITAFLSSLSVNAMQGVSEKTGEDRSKQAYPLLGQFGREDNIGESLIKTSDLDDTYVVAEFNYSDLLPFNFAGQNELAKKAGISHLPAAAHFYKNSNECLRYIAVQHVAGPKPSSTEPGDPTFIMIQEAINAYKPDFVIAEGFTNESYFLEHIALICDKEPGENMYTVQLAKSSNIPFVGGEPTDLVILKDLQQKGYKTEDMAAFYITRQLSELWRNQDPIFQVSDDLKGAVQKVITQVCNFMPDFTYEQWQAWIIRHYGKTLPFEKFISGELVVPHADGEILEKLSNETGLVRDREILLRILEANDKGFERILVVYGASHYYTQHKVLENYFGIPTYTSSPHNQWSCMFDCCTLL